jgi:hypothetical protein
MGNPPPRVPLPLLHAIASAIPAICSTSDPRHGQMHTQTARSLILLDRKSNLPKDRTKPAAKISQIVEQSASNHLKVQLN